MQYREYPPAVGLRPYVRCFWVLRTPAAALDPATRQRVLPDGCMDIILALSPPGQGNAEIGVVVPRDDVAPTHARALAEGASDVQAPHEQPWGQIVSYVRDPDGHLVEVCSPVG